MTRNEDLPAAPARVLVIEDDFSGEGNLSTMLTEAGLAVTVEEDVVLAVQRLREEHWDLAVADAELLGRSGLVLLEMARAITHTMFLLVLGEQGPDHALAARRVGAAGILTRPVDARELGGLALELLIRGRAVDAHAQLFH